MDTDPIDESEDNDSEYARLVNVNCRQGALSNLWYRLIGRDSATRSWQRQADPDLVFDLDKLTLCGVDVGSSVNRLQDTGLGPADESYGDGVRALHYPDLGLDITAYDSSGICILELHWYDREWKHSPDRSFPGRCLFDGRELSLSSATKAADVQEMLGPPTTQEEGDEGFSSLEYRVSKGEITFSFDDEEGGGLSFALCHAGFMLKDF